MSFLISILLLILIWNVVLSTCRNSIHSSRMSSNVVPAMNISPITPIRFNGIFSVFQSTLLTRKTYHLSHEKIICLHLCFSLWVSAQWRQEENFIYLYTPWSNKHGPWLNVCWMEGWMDGWIVIQLLLQFFNMPQGGHDLISGCFPLILNLHYYPEHLSCLLCEILGFKLKKKKMTCCMKSWKRRGNDRSFFL